MKRCCICRVTKPLSAFYRARNRPDGYQTACKPCLDGKNRTRYHRVKGKPVQREIPSHKHCPLCQEDKPAAAFHRRDSSRDGLDCYCKTCWVRKVRERQQRVAKSEPVLPESGRKTCKQCKVSKPLVEFHKNRVYLDHRHPFCKACTRSIQRSDNLRRKGISDGEYQRMHDKQDGKCAVCGRPETSRRHGHVLKLAVDHNHHTGKNRGLLCGRCNTALGLLNDDPATIRSLLRYLRKHR